eukprot:gene16796-biopygen14354
MDPGIPKTSLVRSVIICIHATHATHAGGTPLGPDFRGCRGHGQAPPELQQMLHIPVERGHHTTLLGLVSRSWGSVKVLHAQTGQVRERGGGRGLRREGRRGGDGAAAHHIPPRLDPALACLRKNSAVFRCKAKNKVSRKSAPPQKSRTEVPQLTETAFPEDAKSVSPIFRARFACQLGVPTAKIHGVPPVA